MKLFTKVILGILIVLLISSHCQAVKLGFENKNKDEKNKKNWLFWKSGDYTHNEDDTIRHTGKFSHRIDGPEDATKKTFGCYVYNFHADAIGKQVELSGYIKTRDVNNGWAGLFIRIDSNEKMVGFDNSQKNPIKGTTEWMKYTIKLPFSPESKKLFIGAILVGDGTMWIDGITLKIDGKDWYSARPVYKADSDKEFDHGSKITTKELFKVKPEVLSLIGKMWGFLKYYHPDVLGGNYNWDNELFRLLPKIIDAKNDKNIQEIFEKWLVDLGEPPKFGHNNKKN